MYIRNAGQVANTIDPDQLPHSAASDLGLCWLLRPVCLNTSGKYNTFIRIFHFNLHNYAVVVWRHKITCYFRTKKKIYYRIRPNYHTVRFGFSNLQDTLICGQICIYLLRIHYKKDQKRTYLMMTMRFFLTFFTKAYVVGTHLNCIDLSMQFKWVPTTYAFVKK